MSEPLIPFHSPVSTVARAPVHVSTKDEAMTAAREFEAMFLTQSFEQSFKTLPQSAFGGGHAGETWRHFLAKAIADEVSAGGGTGIADWLAPQIAVAATESAKP